MDKFSVLFLKNVQYGDKMGLSACAPSDDSFASASSDFC